MKELYSPNGKLCLKFSCDGEMRYSVYVGKMPIVLESCIGFELESPLGPLRIVSEKRRGVNEQWRDSFGENAVVPDNFTEARFALSDGAGGELLFTARAYDEGVAFKVTFLSSNERKDITIINENTEFNLAENPYAYCAYKAQGPYYRQRVNDMEEGAERPLVVELADGGYIAIGEAALVDYARMKLDAVWNRGLISRLSGKPEYFFNEEAPLRQADERRLVKVKGRLPLETPWRVIIAADSPAELFMNKRIIKNLNEPCAIDAAFVKPGKVIRVTPLTTENGLKCVDFALKRGFSYIEIDAGWYGEEGSFDSDAATVSVDPKRYAGPFDLFEILRCAKEKGIGVILYINQRAMMNQLDELLPLYKSWGVAGIKYGFVEVGTQRWTRWLHECVRKAAAHGLVLTIHDEYRPTGYERTYPNLLTQEGIRGDEERQPPSNTLTTIFTRMLAGPGDNTVCYFDKRVDELWTHAFQLAKSLAIFSPLQFLYWYDCPDKIEDSPEQDFFTELKTVWDETIALDGEVGKHFSIARRSGEKWFLGVMNAEDEERTFDIKLNFLAPGATYEAWIYTDDPTVPTRAKVKCERVKVTRESVLSYTIDAPGGLAATLTII